MKKENDKLHSIERSKLSGARKRPAAKSVAKKEPSFSGDDMPRASRAKRSKKRRSMKRIITFFVFLVVIILVLVTTTFSSSTIDVKLATKDIQVDGIFSAVREPSHSADISYTRLGPYAEERTEKVTNITRERENSYAEGTIVVYNTNVSGEKLDLVNRTRFLSGDNKLYRLQGKQVIPGGRDVNGEFVPGSKEVKVIADNIGNTFNISEKGERFSIPGLSKYKEFSTSYAISKTNLVGGFSGEKFIPNAEEEREVRARLRKDIEETLNASLVQALDTNTLSKRVVFDTGKFISYESLENEQVEDGVILREKGTLNAISFRERELAVLLATSDSASNVITETVNPSTVNVSSLNMSLVGQGDFDIISSTEFSFRLSGSAKVFWDVDEVLFLGDLAGKSKDDAKEVILTDYPQITKIEGISLFPIWRTKLPGNKNKISLEYEYEDQE